MSVTTATPMPLVKSNDKASLQRSSAVPILVRVHFGAEIQADRVELGAAASCLRCTSEPRALQAPSLRARAVFLRVQGLLDT